MEEEEFNDIVTYIQDQKYPQNAETSNVWFYYISSWKNIIEEIIWFYMLLFFSIN
jgi:hypothetical protein